MGKIKDKLASLSKGKKIAIAVIALVVLIAGVAGTILLLDSSKDKEVKKETTIETYEETTREPWTFRVADDTNSFSDEDLKQMQEDCTNVINQYNDIVFNFNANSTDTKARLDALYVPDGTEGTDKANNATHYAGFKSSGITSTFNGYEPQSFNINDGMRFPTVTVNGLVSVHYQSNNVAEGDYKIVTKMLLELRDGKWQIYSANPSTIYEAEGLELFSENNGNNIIFKGNKVSSLD